ncbi:MAG: hypothetical protein AAF733_01255 [Verrucomicrobiota bacterium]
MSSSPASTPSRSRRRAVEFAHRAVYFFIFVGGILFSGNLGIEMAKSRLPAPVEAQTEPTSPQGASLTLGTTGEPVYLAESPDELRRFFATFTSPGARASADLSGLGIRRINAYLIATTLHAESDAIEVEINSGAISGAVYWVHHTQIPDRTAIDPIISPVPVLNP